MSGVNRDEFDRQFDEAFAAAAKDHTVTPDFEPSWLKVEKKLQRRSKRKIRMKTWPYIAASFILGALLFSSPAVSMAFNPFKQAIQTIQEGFISLVYGSDEVDKGKAKTDPPPDFSGNIPSDGQVVDTGEMIEQQFESLEEIIGKTEFEPPKTVHAPDGYQLVNGKLFFHSGQEKANSVVLFYTGPENKRFSITMGQMEPNEKLSSNYRQDDGEFETVKLGDEDAYLFTGKDGTSSLEYMRRRLFIAIVGQLSRDDIMETAKNLQ